LTFDGALAPGAEVSAGATVEGIVAGQGENVAA